MREDEERAGWLAIGRVAMLLPHVLIFFLFCDGGAAAAAAVVRLALDRVG